MFKRREDPERLPETVFTPLFYIPVPGSASGFLVLWGLDTPLQSRVQSHKTASCLSLIDSSGDLHTKNVSENDKFNNTDTAHFPI